MAIFKKTTKEKEATGKPVVTKSTKAKTEGGSMLGANANVLVRPHITEKSAILAEKGTYVFEVARDTNKIEIANAIKAIYNVTPVRVNIVSLPNTRVFVRNRKGVKSGVRKALVTLKSGDKIEIV
ncbi:MAG: 50S ribosomal protein L23 [Parcubacteria group bacterium GW2011_GWC1_42_11]|uniref:Large ribosomal subunit protein uL23 n=1 Tax=Candidatus Nomurabacteria bacterium GW2011_GWC2_42_20 TaxID=1618756 RepID=A0A0G0ZHH0_9BACT|nr:MAG: 50S ribosomal protein L23 [Parcubacteria group bacterium GW2011_GWC1_42_11]KKS48175.1 MAG: 50S ribosomal protein L23 [Candidatus Nomurabacteria bacterium GW2011_GWC2_42_20]KKS57788.1 MAG: 50S ribosomal protein L23 [Candidatus Nomurabacteria bacterium GW2011_GWA2_42_41]KKT08505.1 MAG: 50S ribosomal protein L23 [Candidatus Nomurabacteria bacterium GW2011_GWB1_43_20]TAN37132.1 MAG: 50S ribosomal protein L23 [Patescibacteria group bacterium]HBH71524.1 50S ribosomal protein L23 [Candidatus 